MNILKLFREYEAKHEANKPKAASVSLNTPSMVPEPSLSYEIPSEESPSWMSYVKEPMDDSPLFQENVLSTPAEEPWQAPSDWMTPTQPEDPEWMRPFLNEPLSIAPETTPDSLSEPLQSAWNNADELFQQIQYATEMYLVDYAILKAGKRLLEIDPQHERAVCVYAEALMQFGDYAEAETILKNDIEKFGETAMVLFSLAKTYDIQDRKSLRQSVLQRSLALDPNYEPALTMCLNIDKIERGHHAYMESLTFLAANDDAWLAKSWLANVFLDEHNIDQAMPLLRTVVKAARNDSNLLKEISTKLGQQQYCKELIKLFLPIYNPSQHDLMIGYNLLQACVETNNKQFGEAVLQNIRDANLPNVNLGLLAEFAAKLGLQ